MYLNTLEPFRQQVYGCFDAAGMRCSICAMRWQASRKHEQYEN